MLGANGKGMQKNNCLISQKILAGGTVSSGGFKGNGFPVGDCEVGFGVKYDDAC